MGKNGMKGRSKGARGCRGMNGRKVARSSTQHLHQSVAEGAAGTEEPPILFTYYSFVCCFGGEKVI